MKKISIYLLTIVSILFISINNVTAATNPYKKELSWGGINCTWYAWQKVYDTTGVALAGFTGNARNWYNDAQKKGYTVGSEPRAKAVVVWDNYLEYGHVGYVERVEGTDIYYWDSNGGCYAEYNEEEKALDQKCWEEWSSRPDANQDNQYIYEECRPKQRQIACKTSGVVGYDNLVGYIYTDIPRKVTATPKAEKKPVAEEPKAEPKKSSNNNLKDLKINEIDFEFKKDILEYELEVENDIESVVFEATLEDEKAQVVGLGEQKLEIGENKIEIKVIAEDESVKTYVFNIKRLEDEKDEKNEEKSEKQVVKKSKKISIYIILGALLISIIVSIVIIVIIKKKKKMSNK